MTDRSWTNKPKWEVKVTLGIGSWYLPVITFYRGHKGQTQMEIKWRW